MNKLQDMSDKTGMTDKTVLRYFFQIRHHREPGHINSIKSLFIISKKKSLHVSYLSHVSYLTYLKKDFNHILFPVSLYKIYFVPTREISNPCDTGMNLTDYKGGDYYAKY